MADCGATGSAIDRSARLISSAIVGQNNGTNEATVRAGKAIGSFMGTASVPAANASAHTDVHLEMLRILQDMHQEYAQPGGRDYTGGGD